MSELLLIVNPVAGKLRARSMLFDIIDVYSSANIEVCVRFTQHRGHARALAAAATAERFSHIVCVGGDGTLNEVISGVLDSGENIPLGYIPLGSTNDFASSMKLSRDVPTAARAVIEGAPIKLDVGDFCGTRKFSYIASFGAFTSASYTAPQNIKNTLGFFAYILEGIKALGNIKSVRMRVETDDISVEDDFVFGAVANSTSIGRIVKLGSEYVDMCDGLFEIVLIKQIRGPQELSTVVASILTSDFSNDMFVFTHSSKVNIFTEQDINWSLDGEEAASGRNITIRNLHRALTFIK